MSDTGKDCEELTLIELVPLLSVVTHKKLQVKCKVVCDCSTIIQV